MTNRRRRQVAAAAELCRLRRPREYVELPDAHDPTRRHRVDGFILDHHRQAELGLPTSDEYDVTGWLAAIADRAQDFEHGTVYLDSVTGAAGTAGWYTYQPLPRARTAVGLAGGELPADPGAPTARGRTSRRERPDPRGTP